MELQQTEKKNQRVATFVPHLPPLDIVTVMLHQCHIKYLIDVSREKKSESEGIATEQLVNELLW